MTCHASGPWTEHFVHEVDTETEPARNRRPMSFTEVCPAHVGADDFRNNPRGELGTRTAPLHREGVRKLREHSPVSIRGHGWKLRRPDVYVESDDMRITVPATARALTTGSCGLKWQQIAEDRLRETGSGDVGKTRRQWMPSLRIPSGGKIRLSSRR